MTNNWSNRRRWRSWRRRGSRPGTRGRRRLCCVAGRGRPVAASRRVQSDGHDPLSGYPAAHRVDGNRSDVERQHRLHRPGRRCGAGRPGPARAAERRCPGGRADHRDLSQRTAAGDHPRSGFDHRDRRVAIQERHRYRGRAEGGTRESAGVHVPVPVVFTSQRRQAPCRLDLAPLPTAHRRRDRPRVRRPPGLRDHAHRSARMVRTAGGREARGRQPRVCRHAAILRVGPRP